MWLSSFPHATDCQVCTAISAGKYDEAKAGDYLTVSATLVRWPQRIVIGCWIAVAAALDAVAPQTLQAQSRKARASPLPPSPSMVPKEMSAAFQEN